MFAEPEDRCGAVRSDTGCAVAVNITRLPFAAAVRRPIRPDVATAPPSKSRGARQRRAVPTCGLQQTDCIGITGLLLHGRLQPVLATTSPRQPPGSACTRYRTWRITTKPDGSRLGPVVAAQTHKVRPSIMMRSAPTMTAPAASVACRREEHDWSVRRYDAQGLLSILWTSAS